MACGCQNQRESCISGIDIRVRRKKTGLKRICHCCDGFVLRRHALPSHARTSHTPSPFQPCLSTTRFASFFLFLLLCIQTLGISLVIFFFFFSLCNCSYMFFSSVLFVITCHCFVSFVNFEQDFVSSLSLSINLYR